METLTKILVTGGGAPGSAGILKAIKSSLPNSILYSCDIRENTAGTLLADYFFTVPSGDSPHYIDKLLEQCKTNEITVVLPITTKELPPLALAKEQFAEQNIRVIVSDYNPLNIANNKGLLYHHLEKNAIQVPKFAEANDYEQYLSAKEKIKSQQQKFIIKPCVGNGSRGFRIIDNSIDSHELLFNHKPTSTYIKESELDEILKVAFPPILVSEYLPGTEYTVDCLVQNGKTKLIIPRRRDKMNNGISVEGVIEKNNEVIDYCSSILNSLRLDGPIGIQVKYSQDNKPLLVEINPRIQGTTVACIGAGVNIPRLCLDPNSSFGLGNKTNDININWGTKFIRHYEELYF